MAHKYDLSYDEIACEKHVKELHKDSDIRKPSVVKVFVSSTAREKRGNPIDKFIVK